MVQRPMRHHGTVIVLLGGLTALLLAALFLGGCAPSNLAEVIKAAGQDQATVCTRVTTIYGTLTFMRSNVGQGGDVSCDTLTIKVNQPPQQAVIPMTITPTFTVTSPKP